MTEIHIHLPLSNQAKIYVIVLFPIVPRVGEKIYLSKNQKKTLLDLLKKEEEEVSTKWEESIDEFTCVEEVAYNGVDGSIHIELSKYN